MEKILTIMLNFFLMQLKFELILVKGHLIIGRNKDEDKNEDKKKE